MANRSHIRLDFLFHVDDAPLSASVDFMKFSANDESALRIAAFLDDHRVMSLATSGPSGPHAANVFYAHVNMTLLWVSSSNSEHSRHIDTCSRVAATIAADSFDYTDIKGLQIHGEAWRIDQAAERNRARAQLELRFEFLRRIRSGPAALREAYKSSDFYRLEPTRFVLIDNSRGFGFKETLDFNTAYEERMR